MFKKNKKTKEDTLLEKKRIIVHENLKKYQKVHLNEPKESPEGVYISLQNINKIYENHVQAVYDFNLDIKKNEFIVFVGPSGCGKSTTLRMIAGLEEITAGDLYIDGFFSNGLEPRERDIAMVFQSYALYPHMTVYDNVAFGLKMRHVDKKIINQKVHEVAKLLDIEQYLDRKPKALSGGQRQRVALGRAIARNAKVFLMDEPLSNLDAKLRVQMRSELVALHQKINATTIYVTHDQTEAMTMASRIVVMKDGYVQQIGTPAEIFTSPSNLFVATFIGSPAMNLIDVTYDDGNVIVDTDVTLNIAKTFKEQHDLFYKNCIKRNEEKITQNIKMIDEFNASNANKKLVYDTSLDNDVAILKNEIEICKENLENNSHPIILGVRPEYFLTENQAKLVENKSSAIKAHISLVEMLGSEYIIHATALNNKQILIRTVADKVYSPGEEINVYINIDKINLFDPTTTLLI